MAAGSSGASYTAHLIRQQQAARAKALEEAKAPAAAPVSPSAPVVEAPAPVRRKGHK
jgi:hypothetical protein